MYWVIRFYIRCLPIKNCSCLFLFYSKHELTCQTEQKILINDVYQIQFILVCKLIMLITIFFSQFCHNDSITTLKGNNFTNFKYINIQHIHWKTSCLYHFFTPSNADFICICNYFTKRGCQKLIFKFTKFVLFLNQLMDPI